MLEAAAKALAQMFSPPFRVVLWKSVALAVLLLIVIGAGLHRALLWLATMGEAWAENALGMTAHLPLSVLVWVLSLAAGLGIVAGSLFLMPAVTALVASFFVDDIAEQVERAYYPDDPAGKALPFGRALIEGAKVALLALLVYLIALPFLLFAGLGALIFFFATAFLLGREYFILAAMRFRPPAEAKALRRAHQGTVFIAGLLIALFVSVPILNFATPLFGMAFMVHMHKLIARREPALIGRDIQL
jgi:CysZ protein